jgi:hypothetical protein
MDLKELSLNDSHWRKVAYNISGCKDTANDIVQEMYLKLHNVNKEVNPAYITLTMRSIFIDMNKSTSTKNRFIPVDDIDQYDSEDNAPDYEKAKEINCDYEIVKSVFNQLPFHHKVIIEQSYIDGVRKFSRESKIYVDYITRCRKQFKLKTWEELGKKNRTSKELETLLQQSLQQLALSRAKIAKTERIFLM